MRIMLDPPFDFYYLENLEVLVKKCAGLIIINSFKDGLHKMDVPYIRGGFPQFFLEELEGGHELRRDIAESIEGSLPVYAECGGLIYLLPTHFLAEWIL